MRIAKGGEYPYFHHLKNTIDKNTQKLFDKDVLNEQERSTAVDLYIEYNKNIADVNKFLLLEYSVLQNKIRQLNVLGIVVMMIFLKISNQQDFVQSNVLRVLKMRESSNK